MDMVHERYDFLIGVLSFVSVAQVIPRSPARRVKQGQVVGFPHACLSCRMIPGTVPELFKTRKRHFSEFF